MADTSRLEAFSDGVLAIAITLLVLDIAVPGAGHGALSDKLGRQWPSYAAYAVSFLTIGIIWINHHAMVARLAAVDHSVLMLNLLLLLTVGLLPWTTALIAHYLRQGSGQHLAAAIYAGSFLMMSIAFYAMQRHILRNHRHLLHERLDDGELRAIDRRNRFGLIPYAVAAALAPLSAYLTLAICALIAAYYAIPQGSARTGADTGP
ncbi:MAG TPA: TMEM175 family protein [Solirubrobacteraceae bacterium]|nr:TMEM175 family protein [Solirubrobacteraceae bacterium]